MKRILVLPMILGLMLSLTGCRSDEGESRVPESALPVTASETTSNVIESNNPEPSQIQGTELQHSEPVMTEALDIPPDADTPVSTSKEKSVNAGTSDVAVPQLETVPEEDDVEEDTGDFGELFS